MKVKIFPKNSIQIWFLFTYFLINASKRLILDTDRFWHSLDIMACIVHKVVKELDVAEC